MAVGVFMSMPGVRQRQYEQVNERLFGRKPFDVNDAPEGLVVHSAGPIPDGWYIFDIWESKDDFKRFVDKRLGPAVQEVMGVEIRNRQPEFHEIANLVSVPKPAGKGKVARRTTAGTRARAGTTAKAGSKT